MIGLALALVAGPVDFPLPPRLPSFVGNTNKPKSIATVTLQYENFGRIAIVRSSSNLVTWVDLVSTTNSSVMIPTTEKQLYLRSFVPGTGSVSFTWDAGETNHLTAIHGYLLFWGPGSRTYTNSINVGKVLTGTVTNLMPDTIYYFGAVSYGEDGLQSDFSNEVRYTTPHLWQLRQRISAP